MTVSSGYLWGYIQPHRFSTICWVDGPIQSCLHGATVNLQYLLMWVASPFVLYSTQTHSHTPPRSPPHTPQYGLLALLISQHSWYLNKSLWHAASSLCPCRTGTYTKEAKKRIHMCFTCKHCLVSHAVSTEQKKGISGVKHHAFSSGSCIAVLMGTKNCKTERI